MRGLHHDCIYSLLLQWAACHGDQCAHTLYEVTYSLLSIIKGEYLWERIQSSANFEVAFVWNRSTDRMRGKVPDEQVLVNLEDFAERHVT